MKQAFTKVLFLVFLLSVFSGCATTSSSKDELAKSTPYEFQEISAEKQVLVYDKTISLPTYALSVEFSPTNENEVTVSLMDDIQGFGSTDYYATIDLKSGKVKKDIKLNNEKEEKYSKYFKYSDNGKKLYLKSASEKVFKNTCGTHINAADQKKVTVKKICKDTFVREHIEGKYNIFDLQTGKLSIYYNDYNCDELIPKELKKDGIEAYCSTPPSNTPDNLAYYYYEDKINKKYGQGIAIYDKDSFKPIKIITADSRLDTEFKIQVISEDGQYVLFEKIIRDANEQLKNRKYVVYDLKNDKTLHSFDTPFTVWEGGTFFIDKDTLVFEYNDGSILSGKKINKYMGIINLNTNEKKIVSDCGKGKCPSRVDEIYNLNSRYMMWNWYSTYYIFDKKELKIVQDFKSTTRYAVSKKFKKVAFVTNDNKLHLYNIAQGE